MVRNATRLFYRNEVSANGPEGLKKKYDDVAIMLRYLLLMTAYHHNPQYNAGTIEDVHNCA